MRVAGYPRPATRAQPSSPFRRAGEVSWSVTFSPLPCLVMNAPIAKQIPFEWTRPTGPATDPWAWLWDRDDPDTITYLEAENAYADAWFAPRAGLVETVFEEIKSRVQETDLAAPVRKDGWWYTSRTEQGLSYGIHCRGRSREAATEQI